MPSSIDVVLVTYNSERFLARLSASLRKCPSVASISVVDNDSADRSAALAQELDWGAPVYVVAQRENVGFGRAMNRGSIEPQRPGDYLLIVNPDVEIPAGVLDALAKRLDADATLGVIGVQLLTSDGGSVSSARDFPTPSAMARRQIRDVEHHGELADADWICGALMMWRREAYEEVGGFDDHFFLYYEDVDICASAHRAGWRVRIDGTLSATHDQGHGVRTSPALRRASRRSRRYYARKWLGARGIMAAAAADTADLAASVYHALKGDRR